MSATEVARGLVTAPAPCRCPRPDALAGGLFSVDRVVGIETSCSKDDVKLT